MRADLFNEKTINKNITKIEPNSKQITASKKWIELLQEDELQEEVSNYPKFMIYILKDLLGYDITDFKHEEKNMEFPFKDKSGNFLVCFEAKGTKTKDLWALQGRSIKIRETPVNQINDYLYKNKIPYGVLTNYKDFVLFKREEGYTKYHKIDFLDIKNNSNKLKEFIFIFSKDSFEKDNNNKLYNDSILEERNLTKSFYKLYHETRLMILKEFKESELEDEKCLHYTQLFLNRLMFILFAEDTDLLDKKYFRDKILKVLDKSGGIDNYTDYIFGKIKSTFRELDQEIPKQIKGFNGELFKEEIDGRLSFKDYRNKPFFKDVFQGYKLDKEIQLNEYDKNIFNKHKNRLSKIIENILLMDSFDFKSEVNVNILGHIFEQSISDIENLKETNLSKRKKEGIFYTPEYVTDYICRNTIIPYLSKSGTDDINELIDEYSKDIGELEKKFKSIKILDPACGSGAFLIKSTEILFEIFEKIQFVKENYGEYQASRGLKVKSNFKGQLTFKKWDEKDEIKNIMENNIYGVDINEESVEITKLSLFLKIARKNKKLINLSNNIKCGNSLVGDLGIDKKAFDWDKEFPFKFDVIIGNPPYVSQKGTFENPNIAYKEREFYRKNYKTLSDNELKTRGGVKLNLFGLWIEKSLGLLSKKGLLGLIVHKNLLKVESYKFLRKYILDKVNIKEILDLGAKVFEDVTGETIILVIQNDKSESNNILVKTDIDLQKKKYKKSLINQDDFFNNVDYTFNIYENKFINDIKNRIIENSEKLEKVYDIVSFGLNTSDNKKYFIEDCLNEKYKKAVMGRDVAKWSVKSSGYVFYDNKVLTRKGDVNSFTKEKLILQRIGSELTTAYDNEGLYCYNSTNMILQKNRDFNLKYLMTLLNSKLVNYYYVNIFSMNSSLTVNVTQGYLSQIPIKIISLEQQKPFIDKADFIIDKTKQFYEAKRKFIKLIKYKYNLNKTSRKLDTFYKLDFKEFVNEIQDKKKTMSIEKESELMAFFEKNKKEILGLMNELSKTEIEIDKMVYDLYGITNPKDREIIEKS